MRGNHRIWGRQDYVEPQPISIDDRDKIASCVVTPRFSDRTNPNNWHEVRVNGVLIGFVKTSIDGQCFRTPGMEFWLTAAMDWNRSDPHHSYAILRLLDINNNIQ
jgi:hypothetical protein